MRPLLLLSLIPVLLTGQQVTAQQTDAQRPESSEASGPVDGPYTGFRSRSAAETRRPQVPVHDVRPQAGRSDHAGRGEQGGNRGREVGFL